MPPALMEKICAPAEASLLRKQDALSFLRDVRAWSLGPKDEERLDQLLIFVEDNLGFAVFEAIEAGKRVLSDAESTCIRYAYPGIEVEEPVTRAQFRDSSARATDAILQALDATLADAGTPPEAIDIVCCTGGTAAPAGARSRARATFRTREARPVPALPLRRARARGSRTRPAVARGLIARIGVCDRDHRLRQKINASIVPRCSA